MPFMLEAFPFMPAHCWQAINIKECGSEKWLESLSAQVVLVTCWASLQGEWASCDLFVSKISFLWGFSVSPTMNPPVFIL